MQKIKESIVGFLKTPTKLLELLPSRVVLTVDTSRGRGMTRPVVDGVTMLSVELLVVRWSGRQRRRGYMMR